MKIQSHQKTTTADDLPRAMRQFIVSVIVLTLSIQPLFLFGQGASKDDWSNVMALSPGLEVSIEKTDRRTLRGVLQSVSDTAVTVSVNGRSDTVNRADVKKLYRTSKGSRGKAIAIGAAVGAGVGTGVGFGALGATGGSDDTGGVLAGFIAIGAGVGAALGALAGRTKKTLVFEAR
ncbi:MAG TPA: hypothetical protein VNA17_10785 [Pyrinomonadaceae bacterium]|nr:hypothetical protein [Pyrinomonadaceae bacterium]